MLEKEESGITITSDWNKDKFYFRNFLFHYMYIYSCVYSMLLLWVAVKNTAFFAIAGALVLWKLLISPNLTNSLYFQMRLKRKLLPIFWNKDIFSWYLTRGLFLEVNQSESPAEAEPLCSFHCTICKSLYAPKKGKIKAEGLLIASDIDLRYVIARTYTFLATYLNQQS